MRFIVSFKFFGDNIFFKFQMKVKTHGCTIGENMFLYKNFEGYIEEEKYKTIMNV